MHSVDKKYWCFKGKSEPNVCGSWKRLRESIHTLRLLTTAPAKDRGDAYSWDAHAKNGRPRNSCSVRVTKIAGHRWDQTKEVVEKSGNSPVAWKIPCCFNKQPTFASTAWPCFVAGTANRTNCGEVQESSTPRLCKWEKGFGFKQQFGRSLLHKKSYWSFVFKCFLNVSVLVPEAIKRKKWHLPPIKLALVFCDLKNFDK